MQPSRPPEGGRAAPCQLLVEADPPFRVRHASDAWLVACGFSEADVLGNPLPLLQGRDTCAATADALRAALQARPRPLSAPGYRLAARPRVHEEALAWLHAPRTAAALPSGTFYAS